MSKNCAFHRLEAILAMHILCAGAEMNINMLYLVQSLADGSGRPTCSSDAAQQVDIYSKSVSSQSHFPQDTGTDHESTRVPDGVCVGTGGKTDYCGIKGDKHTQLKNMQLKCPTDGLSSHQSKRILQSKQQSIDTLNILGVQPSFKDPRLHSETTADEEHSTAGSPDHSESYGNDAATSSSSGETPERGEVERCLLDWKLGPPVEMMGGIRLHHEGQRSLTTIGTQSMLSSDVHTHDMHNTGQVNVDVSLTDFGSGEAIESSDFQCDALRHDPQGKYTPSSSQVKQTQESNSGMNSALLAADKPTKSLEEDQASQRDVATRTPFTPIEDKLEAIRSPLGETNMSDNLGQHFRFLNPTVPADMDSKSFAMSIPAHKADSRCTHCTHSTDGLSGGAVIPGSHVAPSTILRRSDISIPLTIEGGLSGSSMFESWPGEVMLAYTLNMASVVIYGRTSLIQKVALEGKSERAGVAATKRYGLVQLAEFTQEESSTEDGR